MDVEIACVTDVVDIFVDWKMWVEGHIQAFHMVSKRNLHTRDSNQHIALAYRLSEQYRT